MKRRSIFSISQGTRCQSSNLPCDKLPWFSSSSFFRGFSGDFWKFFFLTFLTNWNICPSTWLALEFNAQKIQILPPFLRKLRQVRVKLTAISLSLAFRLAHFSSLHVLFRKATSIYGSSTSSSSSFHDSTRLILIKSGAYECYRFTSRAMNT